MCFVGKRIAGKLMTGGDSVSSSSTHGGGKETMTHLRFKRHYKLLLLLALVAVMLGAGAGDQRIVAYNLQSTEQLTEAVITYGHSLAALVESVPDSIHLPGTAQTSSPAGSE
jgi:hypothetical protein